MHVQQDQAGSHHAQNALAHRHGQMPLPDAIDIPVATDQTVREIGQQQVGEFSFLAEPRRIRSRCTPTVTSYIGPDDFIIDRSPFKATVPVDSSLQPRRG